MRRAGRRWLRHSADEPVRPGRERDGQNTGALLSQGFCSTFVGDHFEVSVDPGRRFEGESQQSRSARLGAGRLVVFDATSVVHCRQSFAVRLSFGTQ